jgi:hypothetical protein
MLELFMIAVLHISHYLQRLLPTAFLVQWTGTFQVISFLLSYLTKDPILVWMLTILSKMIVYSPIISI